MSVAFGCRYADALGLLASINHTGFCRQSLIGGNCESAPRRASKPPHFRRPPSPPPLQEQIAAVLSSAAAGADGLLNRTTAEPNPDFFMAQMFHDKMGHQVVMTFP